MRVERPAKPPESGNPVLAGTAGKPDRLRLIARTTGSAASTEASAQAATSGPDKSLEILVVAVGRGNRTAFAELFERVAPRVKGYLMSMGASEDQAEEVAQDVMVAVWRKAGTYKPGKAAATTWIYRIARNRRIDLWRREHRSALDPHEPLLHGSEPEWPSQALEAEELADHVRQAIAALPDELSHILRLAFFEGLTHAEIARRLHLPLGTVKSRVRKAIRSVRNILDPASN